VAVGKSRAGGSPGASRCQRQGQWRWRGPVVVGGGGGAQGPRAVTSSAAPAAMRVATCVEGAIMRQGNCEEDEMREEGRKGSAGGF
jgi:hypothetical protein